jgi:hypothetical protein
LVLRSVQRIPAACNPYYYKILTGTDATSVWGMRAYYGVLDVLSKKAYRKALKSGETLDGYQLLK